MGKRTRILGHHRFFWVASIEAAVGPDGKPRKFRPHKRYARAQTTPLNPHGAGPFCLLKMKELPTTSGVYAVCVDGKVMYVGSASDLSERWGPRGYGRISPRNCFKGGQSTNCKINNRILRAMCADSRVDLWFHETPEPKPTEADLIDALSPSWNHQAPAL